jgi:hypothetical protein
MLRIAHCLDRLDNCLTDGGKVVIPTQNMFVFRIKFETNASPGYPKLCYAVNQHYPYISHFCLCTTDKINVICKLTGVYTRLCCRHYLTKSNDLRANNCHEGVGQDRLYVLSLPCVLLIKTAPSVHLHT